MNEMMTALEAMIRRVVKEELANTPVVVDDRDFRIGLKNYVDNNKPEFAAIVSRGALDMPWFDDAIKAEVISTLDNSALPVAQGVVFRNEVHFRDRVLEIRDANTTPPGYTFATKAAFEREVSETVQHYGAIEDWVINTIVERVRDMDFSVPVGN